MSIYISVIGQHRPINRPGSNINATEVQTVKHCTLSFGHYLQVENNFAEKHVFECCDGSGAVNGVVALKGLKEVGVGRLPVLLFCCMDDPCNRDDTA